MAKKNLVMALWAAAVMLCGCGKDDTPKTINVTAVAVNPVTLSLEVNATGTLTANVSPENATNKMVTWSSAAPLVATVDLSGKVTATAPGEALITATTADGGHTASCTVTVLPSDVLTVITDPAFKAYAQHRMNNAENIYPAWDSDKNGKLSLAEAAAVEYIDVSGGYPNDGKHKVTSMAGLEYFTGLTNLSCSANSLTKLDISKNTALRIIYCDRNAITSLDVSKNIALLGLYCYANSLASLDLSKNTALRGLGCTTNLLTTLDVSKNTKLTSLICSENSLTSLDLSKNTALVSLDFSRNSLTGIDLSQNNALEGLYCHENSLKALDVTKNTVLTILHCYQNQLSSLDASKMGFDEFNQYRIYCGKQKTSGGASQTLALTLRANQTSYWNWALKGDSDNASVNVTSLP